jgi:transcriptional regulator with XRE-family HTH domain
MRDFAERLRHLRNERGISVEKLASDTGISPKYLQAIESGERKPRYLYALAESLANALKVNVKDLADYKEI